jgi:hypothetical protein
MLRRVVTTFLNILAVKPLAAQLDGSDYTERSENLRKIVNVVIVNFL